MKNSDQYIKWISEKKFTGIKSSLFLVNLCDHLFGKINKHLFMSSCINIAGIVLSLILLMFFDIDMVYWFKALLYFAFASVFNPFANMYRACRHYYLKQHHLPGPYGLGTIDVFPYGEVDVHFCTLVNEHLSQQLTAEVSNRKKIETELSVIKRRLALKSEIEQELLLVRTAVSDEKQRRLQAESMLEKTKSEKYLLEAKLKDEECLKFSLQNQINNILAEPEYKQLLAKREQAKRQEEERRIHEEEERRTAAIKKKQEEEKKEKEAALQKLREDEKLQQEWAKQIAAAKRRGHEWERSLSQAKRSPRQETAQIVIGPDGRVHRIREAKDIIDL